MHVQCQMLNMICHLENQRNVVFSLDFGVLEGSNGMVWKDHGCNCASCHLPHINGKLYSNLAMLSTSF
jgi:hypothetical protein